MLLRLVWSYILPINAFLQFIDTLTQFARFAATTSSFIIFYVLRFYKKVRFFGYPCFYHPAIPVRYWFLRQH